MSLAPIVRALGGDLYAGGRRATVPGPGHSRHDRSVSLWIDGGRLVAHSFGSSTWAEVLDDLRVRGLIDAHRRVQGTSGAMAAAGVCAPPPETRRAAAARVWSEARPIGRSLALAHLRRRGVERATPVSEALRLHDALPSAVYERRGRRRPALIAAIQDGEGSVVGVEITYLAPGGHRAEDLRCPRKIIGCVPAGAAVRLDPPGPTLLVGEGVFSVLSAADRFGLPAWSLLSAGALGRWSAPAGVSKVVIAADRGKAGEAAAERLRAGLAARGVDADVALPPAPWEDWNAADAAERRAREEGRAGRGEFRPEWTASEPEPIP